MIKNVPKQNIIITVLTVRRDVDEIDMFVLSGCWESDSRICKDQ